MLYYTYNVRSNGTVKYEVISSTTMLWKPEAGIKRNPVVIIITDDDRIFDQGTVGQNLTHPWSSKYVSL